VRVVLALLLLAACPRAPRPAEPPIVSAVLEAGNLQLAVENANPWPLHAVAVDWELSVDEVAIRRGRTEIDVELPANSVTAVPVALPAEKAAAADAVSGTLHTRGPGGRGFAGDFWQVAR
jgi:hypothetical protein